MFIQTESTPNPATLKFLPGQTVMEQGTADFPNENSASSSPLAKRLFTLKGVTGVFLGIDFITVTKPDEIDWEHIKPSILGAIMDHFQSGAPIIEGEQSGSVHAEHLSLIHI